jgi:hypothetical protein
VNLSLFEEVWSTRERELLVNCRIAEHKLSFEVHTLNLQLDYGVRTTEAILETGKCICLNILFSQNPVKCRNLSPRLCIYGKRVVDTFLQSIG